MHWSCCWRPALNALLLVWGILSLIYAFMAGEGGTFWGLSAAGWMWSGLVSGVLAIGVGKKGHGSCGHGCEGGKCC